VKKEDVVFLNQLVKSLEDAEQGMEIAYAKKDYENFNRAKKIMLRIQSEISGAMKK
jgi:hypothetical protein